MSLCALRTLVISRNRHQHGTPDSVDVHGRSGSPSFWLSRNSLRAVVFRVADPSSGRLALSFVRARFRVRGAGAVLTRSTVDGAQRLSGRQARSLERTHSRRPFSDSMENDRWLLASSPGQAVP